MWVSRPWPPVSGVCPAPCFLQVSLVICYVQGNGTVPALCDFAFPRSAGCSFPVNLRPSTVDPVTCYKGQPAQEFCWLYVRNTGKWSSHAGVQVSLVSFAFVLCLAPLLLLHSMGEIMEAPPPPLLIWALVWVETCFSYTRRHSRKLQALSKKGTSRERYTCKIAK